MSNNVSNTYLFYGDRRELVECHKALSKLSEKVGIGSCVDMTTENVVVRDEWGMQIENLDYNVGSGFTYTSYKWYGTSKFKMWTSSEHYGNPVYWHDWVKANFPNLKVAYECEEPSRNIFERVDPDDKFWDWVYISGSNILDEDVAKLPQILRDRVYDGCIDKDAFDRDEVFTEEFQPCDLPDSITCIEYAYTTYDQLRKGSIPGVVVSDVKPSEGCILTDLNRERPLGRLRTVTPDGLHENGYIGILQNGTMVAILHYKKYGED